MNPDDKTTPPIDAAKPSTAEEDAALQAIEALESESSAPTLGTSATDGFNATPDASTSAPVTPATPPVSTPPSTSSSAFSTPTLNPMPATPSMDTSPSSSPSTPPVASSSPSSSTTTPPVESPKTDLSVLSGAADTTAEAPKSSFKPFENQKKSKKSLIILIIVLVVLVLGVGGYFGWQYLQAQNATPTATEPAADNSDQTAADEQVDTQATVTTAVANMQSDLSGLDNTSYNDETALSDATLSK